LLCSYGLTEGLEGNKHVFSVNKFIGSITRLTLSAIISASDDEFYILKFPLLVIRKRYSCHKSASTKHRGRAVNTPVRNREVPGTQISAWRPTIPSEVFRRFTQSLQANAEIVP
jgi:hypothetical protein